MKVAAGIVEYKDSKGLDRCLHSLALGQGGIDTAIIIHGRYPQFPLQIPCATKDTTLVCTSKAFPKGTVSLTRLFQPTDEIAMRNKYLEIAARQGCDWLLVIDSDEYVAPNADWVTFRNNLEFIMSLQLKYRVYDVMFEGTIAERGPLPRLFYKPQTIEYWKKHYWFVLKERKECLKGVGDGGAIVGGIYLLQDKGLRDERYVNAMTGYKFWQQNYEGLE